MSLYNTLFGVNNVAPVLLAALGLTESDVPRFRDCYLHDGGITIYTRTGGGNRDYYENEDSCRECYPEYFDDDDPPSGPWNDDLRNSKHFLYDEDDDFDSTYAYFQFKYPEEYADDLKALSDKDESFTPSQKWEALLGTLTKR